MRLTKKKAIELSIELWTYLAETGLEKEAWPYWKKYGRIYCDCFLCEYKKRRREGKPWGGICLFCSYFEKFGHCENEGNEYSNWLESETEADKKKYAQLFLEQLKSLKS